MKIVFSDHSKNRNLKRKIPKRFIIFTIEEPESVIPSFENRKLRQRRFGDKILEVVTVTEGNIITVVTQYWFEKEEMYED